jgi:hypothetical protein
MGCEYDANSWRGLGFGLANRTEVSVGRVIVPLVYKVNDHLQIAARGIGPELPDMASLGSGQAQTLPMGGSRSFVVHWDDNVVSSPIGPPSRTMYDQVFVVPISMGLPGAGAVNGFLAATATNPGFAQITHVDDAENTEWVRYDFFDVAHSQIVRDAPDGLWMLYRTLTHSGRPVLIQTVETSLLPGSGGSNGGGSPLGGSGGGQAMMAPVAAPA